MFSPKEPSFRDSAGPTLSSQTSLEGNRMATPTVDDHFEIVTATVHWMTRQMPYRIPERPLLHVGSTALADALRTFDPGGPVGLETHCRHLVRRAIRDFIVDRFEV